MDPRIDEILQKCATLRSNLYMNTPHDVGTNERAKQIEKEWLQEIKDIDPVVYKMLVPDPQEYETQEVKKSTE